ncbi:MAG: hypothetical protein ACYDG2_20820 [Ruminiclostridium sp.]
MTAIGTMILLSGYLRERDSPLDKGKCKNIMKPITSRLLLYQTK